MILFFLSFLLLLKIDSSVIQCILNIISPPSTPPRWPLPYSPDSLHLCFLFRKDQPPLEMTAKQDKTRQNKTKQKNSYQGWTRKPNRKKESQKSQEIHLLPLLGVPQKHKAKTHNIYVKNLVKTYEISISISVSPCEPWLSDSVSHALLVLSTSSDSYKLSSPLLYGFLISL